MAQETSPEKTDAKEFIQKRLFPVFVIVELITIILSATDSTAKLFQELKANYYLVISIIWLSALIFLYNSVFKRKMVKAVFFILLTLAYAVTMGYKYWEVNIRKTNHAENPGFQLSLNSIPELFVTKSYGQKRAAATFKIDQFYLNDELCSFSDEMAFKFAVGPKRYRTFAYNQDVNIAFSNGNCTGLYGNKPMRNVLPILQARLDKLGKKELKEYIKTAQDLSRIIATRSDIFNQIIFTDDELVRLKKDDPAAYDVVRDWIVHCIGVKNPVITFDLSNVTTKDVIITKVVYDVLEVGQVKGGASGPLYPIFTYNHTLGHFAGKQEKALIPPFKITQGDHAAFNIRLIPSSKEPGLCWFLKIHLYDSDGNKQSTEPVQIIMSK